MDPQSWEPCLRCAAQWSLSKVLRLPSPPPAPALPLATLLLCTIPPQSHHNCLVFLCENPQARRQERRVAGPSSKTVSLDGAIFGHLHLLGALTGRSYRLLETPWPKFVVCWVLNLLGSVRGGPTHYHRTHCVMQRDCSFTSPITPSSFAFKAPTQLLP